MSKKNENKVEAASEGEATKAVATVSERALANIGGKNFTIARRVTVPVLSMRSENAQVYFKPLAAYEMSKEKVMKDGEVMKSAPVMSVIDLQDNVEKKLILPALAKEHLDETYPDGSYVGKSFAMMKRGKREGKRYNDIELFEIQED